MGAKGLDHQMLEAIRRAFSLAAGEGRINFTPVVPMLSIGDANARLGFLSRGPA